MTSKLDNKVEDDRSWEKIIMKYNRPDLKKEHMANREFVRSLCGTLVPYDSEFAVFLLADSFIGLTGSRISYPVVYYIP